MFAFSSYRCLRTIIWKAFTYSPLFAQRQFCGGEMAFFCKGLFYSALLTRGSSTFTSLLSWQRWSSSIVILPPPPSASFSVIMMIRWQEREHRLIRHGSYSLPAHYLLCRLTSSVCLPQVVVVGRQVKCGKCVLVRKKVYFHRQFHT